MLRLLSNLLSIKPNEWEGVLYFFSISLIFSFGSSFARSIGMTLLVGNLGGDKLPIIFIFIDLAVMVGSMIYASYTRRVSGVAILSFFFLATTVFAVIVQILFLLNAYWFTYTHWNWVYGVFFIGFSFFYILISIHSGSVVASYFTAVQVKRVTPVINAGIPIGGILGGSMLMFLLNILKIEPRWLILVLGLSCLGAYWLLHVLSRHLTPIRTGNLTTSKNGHHSPINELLVAFRYIVRSRLMLFMSIGLILFVIGNKLLEYQYHVVIYPVIYPNDTARASFFAQYEIFANLAWLLIQLFVTSRLMTTFGVGASNLIHPVLTAAISLLLCWFFYTTNGDINGNAHMVLMLAIVAQFINQEMRWAIRTPANNLLFNAIPPNQWGVNKAFLNGIAYPFATLTAGLFLLLFNNSNTLANIHYLNFNEFVFFLPLIVFVVSILGILSALPQWSAYNQGVFGLLNRELFDKRAALGSSNRSNTLKQVIEEKLQSTDYYHVVAALEMVRVMRLNFFVTQVGNLLLKTKDFQVKEHCLNTLAALPQSNTSVTYLLESLKTDQDSRVLPLILRTLTQFKSVNFNASVEKLLDHSDPQVFVEACLCLYKHPLYTRKQQLENRILDRLLDPNQPNFPLYLYTLGEFSKARYSDKVEPYLQHANPEIRLAAFTAYVQMLEGQLENHKTVLIDALNSPLKEIKVTALQALKECQPLENWTPVIRLLGAKDKVLVNESKELLRLNLTHCKSALVIRVFSDSVSVQERFEILSLVYSKLTDQQRHRLRKGADDALKKFLQTQALLKLHEHEAVQSKSHELVNKILQEVMENHLLHLLTVITYASEQSLEFFQRVSRGLLSLSKANQGNALEVLSNAGEKYLVGRILRYYEERPIDVRSINRLYLMLFSEPLPVNENNYDSHLQAIDNDVLRACLHYRQQERTGNSMMERSTSRRVRDFLVESSQPKPLFKRLFKPIYRSQQQPSSL